MRQIYAIGIGGSGAKCVEAVVFLHALGVFGDSKLGVLLVDADSANGNAQRTGSNLRKTINCFNAFNKGESSFMKGEFEDYGLWNPLGEVVYSADLERVFNKPVLSASAPQLAKLMDALYSPKERSADLGVGFRGRPPIGSAVMSRLELGSLQGASDGSWQRLFDSVQIACGRGEEVAIHFFGSVFGGTGAAGVPTLVKLIHGYLEGAGTRRGVHLNASVLLPYFGFEKPEDGEQQVYAETRFFALNTQAALQYLTEQSRNTFDTVYLIGNSEQETYESHTGGANQQNQAHFIELFAALAINHGFQQPTCQTQAAYISRKSREALDWGDVPERDRVQPLLAKGVRFAYAWRYNFALELESARSLGARRFAKGAPWFSRFFSPSPSSEALPAATDETQKQQNEILNEWVKSFSIWAYQIAGASCRGEQLFQFDGVNPNQEPPDYRENLGDLILDGGKSPGNRQLDCVDAVKNALADREKPNKTGLFGLVHALFSLL
jgi:hypothetical protein